MHTAFMENKNHTPNKESNAKPWFVRKRAGWGVRPASWQGWGVTLLMLVAVLLLVRLLAG